MVKESGESSEDDRRKDLLNDLMLLRRGHGLSLASLEQRQTLVRLLRERNRRAGLEDSVGGALALLVELLVSLGGNVKSHALRNAYGVTEPAGGAAELMDDPGFLTGRRRRLAEQLRFHTDTIENYENEKINELALRILGIHEAPRPDSDGDGEHLVASVFVGGTFADVLPYRLAVHDALTSSISSHRLDVEFVGVRDAEPMSPAFDAVESAAIYVGIFGHTFGVRSQAPGRSVAMAEYDRARAAGKTVLCYVADDGIGVPSDLIQSDDLRALQAGFRAELIQRHSAWVFSSPAELAFRVSLDLTRKAQELASPDGPFRVFSMDLGEVRDAIDGGNASTRSQILGFVNFLSESFRPLFTLDSRSYGMHPLLREAADRLNQLIPEVSLSADDGVVRRTGVRHVILRTETVVRLFRMLQPLREGELERTGREIGESAAHDLVESAFLHGRFVPADPWAFVALWNYWDRTGGWGTYALKDVSDEAWTFVLASNFLRTPSPAETGTLAAFWCGYIKGFLNHALPRISALMLRIPEDDRAEQISMPAAAHVKSVEYRPDDGDDDDTFVIEFERGALFDSLRGLVGSSFHRDRHDFTTAIAWAREAFHSARQSEPDTFADAVSGFRLEPRYTRAISIMESFGHPPNDPDLADDCYFLTNQIVHALLESDKGPS